MGHIPCIRGGYSLRIIPNKYYYIPMGDIRVYEYTTYHHISRDSTRWYAVYPDM